MARLNPGKRFEKAFRKSIEPLGYAARINDKCFLAPSGRLLSEPSEGDFWLFTPDGHVCLVECKATAARSFPFASLRPEQEAALLQFDAMSDSFHGIVALNYYGGNLRGRDALYLVAIRDYLAIKANCGRKSLKESAAAEIGLSCPRIKGGIWEVPLSEAPWMDLEKIISAN